MGMPAPPPGAVMAPAPMSYGQVPTVLSQGQQMAKDALPMRLIALLVDGVIIGVVNSIVGLFLFLGPLGFLSYFSIWGLFLAYFVILEGTRGQTIGKMLAGVKVVREDMSPVQFEQALFRALDLFLWGITFGILALIDLIFVLDNGQRFGDRWAKTIVIKTS